MPLTATREQSVSRVFGRKTIEVTRARHETRKALSGWGLDELADLCELTVSEFVTNALHHGKGPITLRLSCDGTHLYIEVHDDGSGRPARSPATAQDEAGRGLELVSSLLTLEDGQLTVREDGTGAGKTVCAAIRLARHR